MDFCINTIALRFLESGTVEWVSVLVVAKENPTNEPQSVKETVRHRRWASTDEQIGNQTDSQTYWM